jgi:hypothetical protein
MASVSEENSSGVNSTTTRLGSKCHLGLASDHRIDGIAEMSDRTRHLRASLGTKERYKKRPEAA